MSWTWIANPAFKETDARNLLTMDPDNALANYLMGSTLLRAQTRLVAYRSVSAIKNKKFAIVKVVKIVKKVEMVSAFRLPLLRLYAPSRIRGRGTSYKPSAFKPVKGSNPFNRFNSLFYATRSVVD